MKAIVLDASAVLALFFDEPGAEKVEPLLHLAAEADKPLLIAAVNWAEVLYRMQRKSGAQGLTGAREFGRQGSLWQVTLRQGSLWGSLWGPLWGPLWGHSGVSP